jgi:arylsulfatase A-like enzyme
MIATSRPRRPGVVTAAVFAIGILLAACGAQSSKLGGPGATPLDDRRGTTDGAARVGKAPPDAPDIVFITTDDQTYASLSVMAVVDKELAAKGTSFTNHYIAFPVCCPARATWLSGLHSHNHGVRGNSPPLGGASKFDGAETVAVWLQKAGYHTSFVGKYLNGYGLKGVAPTPPGWDAWQATLDPGTYQPYNFEITTFGTGADSSTVTYLESPDNYQTDVLTRLALEQIDSAGDEPLFLNINYRAPHSDSWERAEASAPNGPQPAPRHRNKFGLLPDDPATVFAESQEQYADKPPFINEQPWAVQVFTDRREIVQRMRYERESLLAVDEGIQQILDALNARGTLDDALIIFSSDNGTFHGEHGIYGGKYYPYEPAIHTPLIVRGPGFEPGVSTALVSNVDIAPTITTAAGIGTPVLSDGFPLQQSLADPTTASSRALLLEGYPPSEKEGLYPGFVGVRTAGYKLTLWADGSSELYDLNTDPLELNNLTTSAGARSLRSRLVDLVSELRNCRATSCVRYFDDSDVVLLPLDDSEPPRSSTANG